jgi:hypothetical protein
MYAVRTYANRAERDAAGHVETNPVWAQWIADTAEMEARFSYLRSLPFWANITAGVRTADAMARLTAALKAL